MKILNVIPILNPKFGGGVAERTIQLSHHLAKNGEDVGILTLDYGLDEDTLKQLKNVEIINLPIFLRRFGMPLPNLCKIYYAIKNCDVIHFSGHWGILIAVVFIMNLFHKIPYVMCPAGSLKIYGRSKILKNIYNTFIGYKMVKSASLCIAVVEDEIIHFKEYGVFEDKINILPNGIDMSPPCLDKVTSFEDHFGISNKFILFMGRLNKIKGVDILVDSYCAINSKLPIEQDLVIAGIDEGMKHNLMKKIHNSGLSGRVHFLGFVSGLQKQQALSAADVLIIPSRSEAMSIVVLEAAVHETPVICTDQCGLDQFGQEGCLSIVTASVDGITGGINNFIISRNNIDQGVRLKKYVSENFEWSVIVSRYIDMYKKILRNKRNDY